MFYLQIYLKISIYEDRYKNYSGMFDFYSINDAVHKLQPVLCPDSTNTLQLFRLPASLFTISPYLPLQPEGTPQEYSKAILIDFSRGNDSLAETVNITLPPDLVEGSEYIRVTAIGQCSSVFIVLVFLLNMENLSKTFLRLLCFR